MVIAQLISFDLPVNRYNECNSLGLVEILQVNKLSDDFFLSF